MMPKRTAKASASQSSAGRQPRTSSGRRGSGAGASAIVNGALVSNGMSISRCACCIGHRRAASTVPLEELHVPLVLLGRRHRVERAQVSTLVRLAVDLARVETVFTGFEFA